MRTLWLCLLLIAAWTVPPTGADRPDVQRFYDEHGRLVAERGFENGLAYERHYWLVAAQDDKKPDNPGGKGGGNGGGNGGGDNDPGTDCESDKYRLAAWHWTSPYVATASAYASVFDTSAATWDDATSATISGGISAGDAATAGVQDFVNQIDFVPLASTSTIAVTTTWYYSSTGEAVESDAQYNTQFAWATDGNPDAMDVQAIATHELGHTFGLDHPNGNPRHIGCLTMYAYGSEGSTVERTLGDGDILGIQALYGA